MFCSGEEDCL